jgi:CRISPR-associated protein Csd1
MFKTPDDFIKEEALSGEYLLGYHCQRQAFWQDKQTEDEPDNTGALPEGEE